MKNILLGLTLLIASSTNAATITFEETTSTRLDADFQISGEYTHVDTTTGTEWLNFGTHDGANVTFGQSVNDTVAYYADDGFVLATETQVFDLFDFFYADFLDSGNGTMTVPEDPLATIMQERNSWLVGFGTHQVTTGSELGDSLYSTGLYQDDDGTIQYAGFKIFLTEDTDGDGKPNVETRFYSTDFVTGLDLDRDSAYATHGVFMVRGYIPAVPIPAAVWLFGSGLIALGVFARRKHK